jgi:dipeptidyl aminopeptidase/acylaminoacyl peptidase
MKRNLLVLFGLAFAACGGGKPAPTVPPNALGEEAVPPDTDTPPAPAEETAPVAKGNPRDDLIPRAVLFGNPERAGVQLSPDGKYISWLAPSNGVLNVFVAPSNALDQAKVITQEKTRPVPGYYWTFDGKHLLYQQDTAGDENFHVYRVDVVTGETKDLTPYEGARARVLGLSPTRSKVVAVAINDRDKKAFDVYRVDLTSGERTLLVQNDQGFAGFQLDNNLDVRVGEKSEADGSIAWMAHDPKNKKTPWKELRRVAPEDTATTSIYSFDKKGTTLYLSDSADRDTGALYALDLKSGKRKLIFEDTKADVGGVIIHPTQFTLQAVRVTWDKPRWVALDKKIQKDLDGIAKLAEGTPNIASRTLDDKTWIVAFNSDRASRRYFRWDHTKQKGELLFSEQPALDEQPLVAMTPVVIKSRDGLDMVSYLSLPRDADANGDGKADKPVPTILWVHGGPNGRDMWGFNRIHQLLANRGYAVLSVNFRGSTGFGKKFVNAGDRQWGRLMHDDLLDAVEWAVSSGTAPKDRICIGGGSYGGYATLAGLTLSPDTFACGVDIVGPSNIVTLLESIPPYWAPMIAEMKKRVGDFEGDEGKKALLEVSPLSHADKIKKPLLIGQGANDPRVPKKQADEIVAAMQAKKIPVSYVVFPDEGHGFARPENNIAFFAVTEAFLSVHLGGSYQPITDAELKASSMTIEAGKQWLPGLPQTGAGKQASAR